MVSVCIALSMAVRLAQIWSGRSNQPIVYMRQGQTPCILVQLGGHVERYMRLREVTKLLSGV